MKTGGRTKGTPNKITLEVRKIISEAIAHSIENLKSDLDTLPTKDRLELVAKLLNFVLPKLKETELNTNGAEAPTEIKVNIIKSE